MSDNNIALFEKYKNLNMFSACEQCGCCSSACPLTGSNGFNIRRILRFVDLDLENDIASTAQPWNCITCGRCETACPNGIAILDVIRTLRAMTPEEYVPEKPPCIEACPAGIEIPEYIRLIAEGKPNEAYKLILEKVPFPGILGRVCTHPCEDQCRRKEVNESVSIRALKRYAADKADSSLTDLVQVKEDSGHKVAVVGSGPSGLTAAFYLIQKGHRVTVLESNSKPGGMMRYAIPYYRLPESIVDKEINQILDLGIELQTEKELGVDFDLKGLSNQGYDAVFLALGTQKSQKIKLEGADSDDVFWGLDFLKGVKEAKEVEVKEKITVVGGGNVAIDVALTTLRLGAREVTLVCLESREEMPAHPEEIEIALEEGVRILNSWGPDRIISENNKLECIDFVRCTSVFDENGNFSPTFDNNNKERIQTDQVILAIGQTPDTSCLENEESCKTNKGLILVDPQTQETSISGIYAGGDVTYGPFDIINAVASAKRAASSIDKFLGGDGKLDENLAQRAETNQSYEGSREFGFADYTRAKNPKLPVEQRYETFSEVELGLGEGQAIKEAQRCLQCDLEIRLAREDYLKLLYK